MAALAASTVLVGAPLQARESVRYDIEAQSLGDALRAFGVASRQQIIFSENQVRGKRSAALKGTFSVNEGLAHLLAGTGLGMSRTTSGVVYITNIVADSADGQTADASPELAGDANRDIVVTGSRIRQAANQTAAPQTTFTRETLVERGYNQVGDYLNQVTSNAPTFQVVPFAGYPVVTAGRQSPNLFNLGEGRTLSLINGRRVVSSSSGVLGASVDTNSIPVDLIDHVDVIEAGGAAVYGSDAIAGVVNYVLKRDFQGVSLDVQNGISSRGDYQQPSIRLTAGRNFAGGKGNITISGEYSSTSALFYADRPWSAAAHSTVPNEADTGPTDGIPPERNIFNAKFFTFNTQGIIYKSPYSDFNFSGDPSRMISQNGSALQFSTDGQSLVPYNYGTVQSPDYGLASGGQGYSVADRSTLYAGTRRWTTTALAHYDFSPAFKLSGEFSYGRQAGLDPYGGGIVFKIMGGYPGSDGYGLFFNKNNPFLTASEVSTLSAASPSFAGGGSLLLSKAFENILPSRERRSDTETWRSVLALDGDFTVAERALYYSVSYSHGETVAVGSDWEQSTTHLTNALSATRNGAGQIVCSINADVSTANDDPACVPINPFSTAAI
ncbi:MAG: TonB-dependent receptor plug domain-containing protein, partial [Sphingomonas sp.]